MDPILSAPSLPPTASTPCGYGGWALEQAIAVDGLVPGFLATSFRWGAGRRQVAFLGIASLHADDRVDGLIRRLDGALLERGVAVDIASAPRAIIGHALLALRPRKILRAVLCGPLPPGLAGALARLGPDPLTAPDNYADVVRLFRSNDPVDRARVRVLGQQHGALSIGQIRGLAALELPLLHRAVLRHLRDRKGAETFVAAVAHVRRCCSAATDNALRASLDRWPPDRRLKDWLRRWADRADRLPGLDDLARSLAGHPNIELLTTGAGLVAAGRRHRNCLRTMVPEMIAGRHAYVEYRPVASGSPALLGELRWTDRGWVLERIHRPRILFEATEGMAVLRGHLREAGVIVKGRIPLGSRTHHALAAWLDVHPWRGDDNA